VLEIKREELASQKDEKVSLTFGYLSNREADLDQKYETFFHVLKRSKKVEVKIQGIFR